jgi:hypothetical protein
VEAEERFRTSTIKLAGPWRSVGFPARVRIPPSPLGAECLPYKQDVRGLNPSAPGPIRGPAVPLAAPDGVERDAPLLMPRLTANKPIIRDSSTATKCCPLSISPIRDRSPYLLARMPPPRPEEEVDPTSPALGLRGLGRDELL